MLRLVQALSTRNEWTNTCTGMISRLTSEEGSVTEDYALGASETPEASKVLTFNAADQAQIRGCAAQMKVLAIQSGILGSSGKKQAALVTTGASLTSADDAEAIMDSPWAADACGDIAHGYLTAHLARPSLAVAEYCPLYARDLQAMHIALAPAEHAKQDMQSMRKRGSSLKRRPQADAPTASKPALRARAKHPPAALITEGSSTEEEEEGMDFWKGMLQ